MKKITSYVFLAVAVMAAVSCANEGFKKTRSGLQYKIIHDGSGDVVKKGQSLKFNYVQKIVGSKDSTLSPTGTVFPTYYPVDSVGATYNPAEVFGMLRKGDSVMIIMQVDTLLSRSHGALPPFLKKKDKITLGIRVLDIFANDSLVKIDREKYLAAEKDKEIKEIEDYLAKNNITNAKKTKGGVYYQVLSEGTGIKADSGKSVSIMYTGYTLDGKPFDSNQDSTKQVQKHPLTPYEFTSGVSGAITGMLEAMPLFKKGDKVKLFIPSMMGYGPQGAGGGVIKPFANLIFEVEIVDVKDAVPQPAFPKGLPPALQQKMLQQRMQQQQQQANPPKK
jgi:FKBP-type peptidyl-prolyl cis-trans isomerase FkpA